MKINEKVNLWQSIAESIPILIVHVIRCAISMRKYESKKDISLNTAYYNIVYSTEKGYCGSVVTFVVRIDERTKNRIKRCHQSDPVTQC